MSVDQKTLLDAVERIHNAEAVALLSDLVKLDSTLGNEADVQQHMSKLLASLGFEVDMFAVELDKIKDVRGFSPVDWTYDKKKLNVVGIHKPKQAKGKSLIFNGHVDVVPVDGAADQWRAPPFQPVVRDGRLYGRGSGDMKGGIVCFLVAYKALLSLGFKPAAPLYVHAVIEEECTGNGSLACTQRGYNKADACLIPEPFPFICSAQLGVMWFRVAVRGKPVHVLEAGSGINAIEASYVLYGALKKLEEQMNEPGVRHPAYKDFKHPINFNFGVVHGGDWPSSVPSFCQFDVRVGFFPGVAIKDIQRAVEDCISQAAASNPVPITYTLSYRGFQAEGCMLDPTSDALKTLARLHKQVNNGEEVTITPITATTDARFYALYHGIPTTCYGPESTLIHGIDESVSLHSMLQVAKVFAAYIVEWCGVEKQ